MSIEADIKRWKTQHAELEAKYETTAQQLESLTKVCMSLKEEFLSNWEDNWAL